VPGSLFGQCADLDEINAIATAHGLAVIEDGAQSFGGTYKGRYSCGLSTVGCTSFFPSKPLGCYGDGGACFTDDDELAIRMRQIRIHGQSARYRHTTLGLNGRLDTLQAAVLLAKLENFPQEIEQRAQAGERYGRLIREAGIVGVTVPRLRPYNSSVHAQFTIRVGNRAELVAQLAAVGVPTAVHYPIPLHRQPLYAEACSQLSLPHAETAAREVVSLPMYPIIPESVQRRVVQELAVATKS
jgi:UDP-2-acetamido-2-deoxy-ribo-hexuluronate aminotransferase